MEAGKIIREPVRRSGSWSRTLNLINPLRAVWWLVTNVRFAIVLLVLLAMVSLLGVVIPQMPDNVRGDSALESTWLDSQDGRFGFFLSDARRRLFDTSTALVWANSPRHRRRRAYVVAVSGVWRASGPRNACPTVSQMRRTASIPSSMDVDRAIIASRERYKVDRTEEAGTTYLFADRFQIAQLGTLLTHAAIIVFILSAVVRRVDAFEAPLFLAEGEVLPVYAVSNPNQIQVQLRDSYASFNENGVPLDYRSDLTIYDRGEEVLRCSSTVNSPCSYNGFKFYEEAYFGNGAGITVRDAATGNVVFSENYALRATSPRVASPTAHRGLHKQFLRPTPFLHRRRSTSPRYHGAGKRLLTWHPYRHRAESSSLEPAQRQRRPSSLTNGRPRIRPS